jgi:hypothetical protein
VYPPIVNLETLKCALPLAAICGKWVMAIFA